MAFVKKFLCSTHVKHFTCYTVPQSVNLSVGCCCNYCGCNYCDKWSVGEDFVSNSPTTYLSYTLDMCEQRGRGRGGGLLNGLLSISLDRKQI